MRLFMSVPMTPSSAASDPGCRRYRCFLTAALVRSFEEKNIPLSSQQFIAGVVDTGNYSFPPEIVDTGQK
jgi:hypothetical protein